MNWIATRNGVEIARSPHWSVVELELNRRIAVANTPARNTLARMLIEAPAGEPVTLTDGTDTFAIAVANPEPPTADAFAAMLGLTPETPEAPNHAERGHSILGASGAGRWMACPASVRLSEGRPDNPSLAARTGTAAHTVAQMCLESGQDAEEYVGRVVAGIEVTDKMAADVQRYLVDCRLLIEAGCEYAIEVQFSLAALNPPMPMFGTTDFAAYNPGSRRLYILDYKNGYLPVSAQAPQLRYYGLGALLDWPLLAGRPVDTVDLTVCQPNDYTGALKKDVVTSAELLTWGREVLLPAAYATQRHGAPANPGPHCKFCRAAPCVTQAEARLAEARTEFATLPAPPEIRALTPADLGRIMHAAPLIREFLDAVEAAIDADPTGTGFKHVSNPGRTRPWADPDTVPQTLEMLFGLDPWAPREVVSPAEARRMLTAATRASYPTKKAAETAAKTALAGLLGPPKPGTALVSEADPRPAIPNGREFDKVKP